MEYPSRLIEDAVNEISKLPGIGQKTALRLVLHLLKQEKSTTKNLAKALKKMRDGIRYCVVCHNISDNDTCAICTSHRRDSTIVCVVEDSRDVLAIENTGQYRGIYHVLGGVISPIEGIGPDKLKIESLIARVTNATSEIKEIIFALSPTMEGDTTTFYITKKIENQDIKITAIARGIPIGGELEYADEITLGRSIISRIEYNRS
jgi:recombination protein RecR